jgi:hypothetical protein
MLDKVLDIEIDSIEMSKKAYSKLYLKKSFVKKLHNKIWEKHIDNK